MGIPILLLMLGQLLGLTWCAVVLSLYVGCLLVSRELDVREKQGKKDPYWVIIPVTIIMSIPIFCFTFIFANGAIKVFNFIF